MFILTAIGAIARSVRLNRPVRCLMSLEEMQELGAKSHDGSWTERAFIDCWGEDENGKRWRVKAWRLEPEVAE